MSVWQIELGYRNTTTNGYNIARLSVLKTVRHGCEFRKSPRPHKRNGKVASIEIGDRRALAERASQLDEAAQYVFRSVSRFSHVADPEQEAGWTEMRAVADHLIQ